MRLDSETLRAPYFNIMINGDWVDDNVLASISSLQVVQSEEKSDSARIVVSDPSFLVFDSPYIVEGAEVEIYGGYVNNYVRLLKGHIAALDPSFQSNGAPQITIVCMDESYPMGITPQNYRYTKMKRSQVVSLIAKRYGLAAKVQDTSQVVPSILQSHQTDAAFLQKLASDVNFVCYVRDGTVYYHARNLSGAPKGTLYYNSGDSSLISFKPQFIAIKDVQNQVPTVITGDVSLPTKKTTTVKITQKKKAPSKTSTTANKTTPKATRN